MKIAHVLDQSLRMWGGPDQGRALVKRTNDAQMILCCVPGMEVQLYVVALLYGNIVFVLCNEHASDDHSTYL